MDKKEQKNLIKELMERLQEIKKNGFTTRYDKLKTAKLFKLPYPVENYLSKEEEYQLISLKKFMETHSDLSNEEVVEIFKAKKSQFAFLIECESKYEDFVNDVRYSYGSIVHRIIQDRRKSELANRKLP